MDENWWMNKIKELESTASRVDVLTIMNAKINSGEMTRNNIEMLLKSPAFYDCAIVSGPTAESTAQLAKDLYKDCLVQYGLNVSDAQMVKLLVPGLTHINPSMRAVVLESLLLELRRQSTIVDVQPLPNNELIYYVLEELKYLDSICGVTATNILTMLLGQRLNDDGVRSRLLNLLKQNDIIRCRIYELGVKMAKRSATALSNVEFILESAIGELDNDDVLLQASIMEILVPLAEQNHGLVYLERRSVFEVINERVQNIENNPLDMLLIPSIMKFFGKIAAVQPQKIISGYPQLLNSLFELLQSGDESVLPTAIDTMANLAGTSQGKTLLSAQYELPMNDLFAKYGAYMKSLTSALRIRILNSMDIIFSIHTSNSTEVNGILKHWYEVFAGSQQVDQLMELANLPFPDLQLAALSLLRTLCLYRWGISALQRTAGATEWLLSRQSDFHKDVKYLKWQIMELLAVCSEFSPTEIVRFITYVNEGPYYIESESRTVATEPQGP